MAIEPDASKSTRPWVKVLVWIHLFAIVTYTLPHAPPQPRGSDLLLSGNDRFLREAPTKWYLQTTGMWQFWDMFAPNPLALDVWMDAEVTYRDGTKGICSYPRMKSLNLVDRFAQERYRKFFERINGDNVLVYGPVWNSVALNLARKQQKLAGKEVREIDLRRHWLDIQPPGVPALTEYRTAVFYHRPLAPGELSR